MPLISKSFADELSNKEMRVEYLRAQLGTRVAQQIRTLRAQREMSQKDFADAMDTGQSTVSQFEQIDYGRWGFRTLVDMAAAFDVGLVVEFVSYAEFLSRMDNLGAETLQVPAFDSAQLESLCPDSPPLKSTPNVIEPVGQENRAIGAYVFNLANSVSATPYYPLLPVQENANETDRKLKTANMVLAKQNAALRHQLDTMRQLLQMRQGELLPDDPQVPEAYVLAGQFKGRGSPQGGYS